MGAHIMSGYLSLDLETSIQSKIVQLNDRKKRVADVHWGSWKDPRNDFYTIIYGDHPAKIKLLHKKKGFKRHLPFRLRRKLQDTHTIIGTNLKFDLGYIWNDKAFQKWLIKGGKIWDIQVARYLLTGQRHSFPSLAELQKIYLGIKTKKDRISYVFSKNIGADKIIAAKDRCPRLWKLYCEYGIEDGRTPMLIMQKQVKLAKAKNMLPIIKLYNEYLLALTMIETNGLPIDIPQAEKRYQEFTDLMIQNLKKAEELAKKYWTDERLPVLNLQSPQHASVILFGGEIPCKVRRGTGVIIKSGDNKGKEKTKIMVERVYVKGFGLPDFHSNKTKTGYYQTGEDVINHIYANSKNEAAKTYCKFRKTATGYKQKISTYLNAFLYKSVNGVVYPNYNNTETITSRLSASQPNVQNIPKHGEFYKLIQGLIIAPPGWTCCQIDFSQLETYCRALLTREQTLIADLISGKDFHVQNMAWGYGLSYEEGYKLSKIDEVPEWKEKRSGAKAVTFGEAYGQMPESMAARTGWPQEVIEKIYSNMYENYPGLVEFDKEVINCVQQSSIISKKSQLPEKMTKGTKDAKGMGRKFNGDMEVLPIRARDKKSYSYEYNEPRHVGYYQSPTGKLYSFEEYGSRKKDGDIFRYFKPTQMKNYAMQGTAGDIQALTTVAMFQFLLRNPDKVKIVNEIHDSKWFLIKNEYVSCIVPKLCAIMCNVRQLLDKRFGLKIDFEFKADAEIGPNFADLITFKQAA